MREVKFSYLVVFLFLIGFTSATISLNLTTPANNTYSNSLTQTLSANVNSTVNLSNATIYVWNSSGSLYNNLSYIYDTGKALSFDGDDFMGVPDSSLLAFGTNNFSSFGWIKLNSLPSGANWPANWATTYNIYSQGPSSSGAGQNLVLTSTNILYSVDDTVIVTGTHNLQAGNWYFVGVVREGNSWKVYINNTIAGTATSSASVSDYAARLKIGCEEEGAGAFFNGLIDDFFIFNRSLNSTEISQLYNSGRGLYTNLSVSPFNSGLVAGWQFDNNSALGENSTKFVDITGLNNGTCSGSNCPTYITGLLPALTSLTSTLNFASGVYNTTIGAIINFVIGNYTWAYRVFDSAGSSSISPNYTIEIAPILPRLTSLIPTNNTYSNNLIQTLSASVSSTVNLSNATIYVWNSSGVLYNNLSAIYDTGKALSFDGSNDYVLIGNNSIYSRTQPFSFSAWVKPASLTGSQMIVWNGAVVGGNPQTGIIINVATSGDLRFVFGKYGYDEFYITTSAVLTNTSKWYYVVGTYDGSSAPAGMRIYIDGSRVSAALGGGGSSVVNPYSNWTLGMGNGGYYFNGSLDQVLIFNRSLNSTEISQIYNSGNGLYANTSFAPFNSGLVSGYHFDNNSAIGENNTNFVNINGLNNATCSGTTCPNYIVGFLRGPAYLTSTLNFTIGIYNTTLGSIINFVNGIYTWAYQVFDSTGASSMSSNYTINIDTISPSFESLSPVNNTSTTNTFFNFTANISDASGIKNVTFNILKNGNFYNKTYFGNFPDTTTEPNYALKLDGTNDYAQTISNHNITGSSAITVSFWFNPGQKQGRQDIFSMGVPGQSQMFGFLFDYTDEGIYWGSYNNDIAGQTNTITRGQWNHIAASYVGGTNGLVSLYVNGALDASGTKTLNLQNSVIRIGYGMENTGYTNGSIDEVLIFNRSLNSTEISQIYNSGNGLYANTSFAPFNSGLVSGYHFEEGSGTTAIDLTGRNNGNLTNGPTYSTGKVLPFADWVNYTSNSLSYIFSKAYNLTDGIYTWFFESYDSVNNYNTSANSTLIVDTTYPAIGFGNLFGSGGNITSDGNYTIHTFLSNGTFIAPVAASNVEILVVAGGGAGGIDAAGGGGAGGLIYNNSYPISYQPYSIVVGAGGIGGSHIAGIHATSGQNSTFGNLIAIGGGAGGSWGEVPASSGGSGGGCSPYYTCYSGSGTLGQGNNGGSGSGGGAGAAGFTNGTQTGGIGLEFSQFASVAGSPAGWFAAGGTGATGTVAQIYGGGGGGSNFAATLNLTYCQGKNNTGSGGGASGYGGSGYGCPGGTGIVIVRYLTPLADMEENNSIKTQNYIFARAGLIESNFANITFTLSNNETILNSTTYLTAVTSINWTNIPRGVYYYNISACDTSGNCNSTAKRMITLNTTIPIVNLTNPQNNTFSNNASINFTANISDTTDGLKNVTLNVTDLGGNNWGNFDGSTNYVNIGTDPFNFGTNDFSVSAWVKPARVLTLGSPFLTMRIVGRNLASNDPAYTGWQFGWDWQQGMSFGLFNGTSYFAGTGDRSIPASWTYMTGVRNSTGLSLYLNGILVNYTAIPSGVNVAGGNYKYLTVGSCKYFTDNHFFNGSIDEVRIYNRSLSSTEISEIYSSGLKRNASLTNTSLVAWYDFEPTSNLTRLVNVGTQINNGTITGMTYSNSYTSTTSYAVGTLTATVGIVVNLIDGIYNWFYSIFDWAGNNVQTSNQTLTVDTVYPNFNFFAPANNSFFNSTSVLFNITSATSPNASIVPNIDNSLVSWWRMDETNTTGTLVQDYMNRNNGTAVGGASQVTNGKFGDAMSFDGVNDYVDLGTSQSLNFTTGSWCMWVNPTNNANSKPPFGTTSGISQRLYVSTLEANWTFGAGASANLQPSQPISISTWQHLCLILNGTYGTIYKNGIAGTWISYTDFSLAGYPDIGRADTANVYFNGSIDDVMIYNRSLSADEILSLYNATAYNHTETSLSAGTHTFNSYVQDFAGNLNQTGAVTFNVDTTFPTLSADSPLNDSYSNSSTNNFSATAVDSANNVSVFMDLDNSLVSWWRMDDLNSTGGVVDYMGRNNGTPIGATQVTNGKFGDAMSFDWTTQNINLNVTSINSATNMSAQPFSVAVWVNPAMVHTNDFSGHAILGGGSYGWWIAINNNVPAAALYNGSAELFNKAWSSSIPVNNWSFIVATYNSTNMGISVNGATMIYGTHVGYQQASSYFTIGARGTSFNGSIDDVMLFNRSLSASEITSLYANSSTKYLNATVSGLSDGVHNYKVYTQDLAGNVNSTATRTLNVDTVYPQISFQNQTKANGTYWNATNLEVNVSSSDLNHNFVVTDFDNSLVSWYRMDDLNSTGGVIDYMGRNNGTNIGGATQVTNGKFGKAMNFNTSGYINTGSLPDLNSATVSLWFYRTSNTGTYQMLYSDSISKLELSLLTNGLRFYVNNTPTSDYTLSTLNTWYNIVGTFNSTDQRVYVNGISVSNRTPNGIALSATRTIGSRSGSLGFNGSIDDVMIFNRSLSAREIASLYNASANQYYNNFTNLSQGSHTVKSYVVDKAGNLNSTELRTITLDTMSASVNLTNPLNNTFTNSSSNNLTVNVSDNFGIQNGTLYVYNQTDLVNQTSILGYNTGHALSFDGTDDYVEIPDNPSHTGMSSLTLCSWIYAKSKSNYKYAFAKADEQTGTTMSYAFLLDNSADQKMQFQIKNSTGLIGSVKVDSAVPLNTWVQYCGVYNGSEVSIWANGVKQSITANGTGSVRDTTYLYIGSVKNSATFNWNGSIDEVLIFNRSLNSTEITQLYNSGAGLYANTSIAPFNSGLVAGWHFDNSSGDNSTYFVDITGINNGTCSGITCPTYVNGKVINPTGTAFNSGIVSTTVGIVVNLAEGIYNWFYQFFDWAGNIGNSVNNTLTIDQTYPLIEFDASSPNDGVGTAGTFNLTALINETNIANVTINFNNTNYIYDFADNASYFANILGNQYNFSAEFGPLGPTEEINYTVTVTDKSGQQNSTETRLITGNTPPISIIGAETTTTGNYSQDYIIANISFTDAQSNMNFSSVYLYYKQNWSSVEISLYNETNSTENSNINYYLNYSGLIDGIYYLNASATDSIGERNWTATYTILIDKALPSGNLTSPENQTIISNNSNNFTANISDTLGIQNATLNVLNSSNLSQIVNQTTINYGAETLTTTIGVVVNLVDGAYNWFYSIFDWAGNLFDTQNNTLTIDTIKPVITDLVYSPSSSADIDPNTLITINATISDERTNISSVILFYNNGTDWNNSVMYPINSGGVSDTWTGNFTTQENETNYTFYVWFNDSANNYNQSTNYAISSFWDCTWNVSTTSFDAVSGYFVEKQLGNMTITNTGDNNYSGGCRVRYTANNPRGFSEDYKDSYFGSLFDGIYLTPNQIFTLSPNETYVLTATGGFPSSDLVLIEKPYFSITSNITDSLAGISTRYINATMIVAKGVVLYQEIEQPASNVNILLTNQTFNWSAYVRNLGADGSYNNSAYNVTFNWTIPSQSLINKLLNTTLNESVYSFLNDSLKQYSNLSFEFTKANLESDPLIINTPIAVKIYSYGYKNESENFSLINVGNNQTLLENSFNVTFLCNSVADGICISSCKTLDGDWNVLAGCSEPAVGGQTGSSGGGGGGGGAGGGGSFDKSSATFELVRGENQEFELTLENKLDSPKKEVTITVKGNNSQYVIPSPSTIDYLGAKSKENVKFLINAPSYFSSGKYLLEITFSGTIEGNTSTKFTEVRYVTLTILEMKRVTADEYLNNSLDILSKMNSSGLILSEVQSILNSMNVNYDSLNFMTLKEEAAKIEEIYTAATEYVKLKDELNQSMIESEKNGVETSETKKLFLLAEILFNRGDYVAAYAKMKEAKTSYLLETKGEFKLLYAIKNNPIETLGILVSLSALGLGSGYFVRLRLLKRKLRMLTEEEGLLLQLMRVVQKDCFENNKMSMEEYGESMYQYEARLSFVIQEKVTTETQVANLMKLGGKKKALGQEKDRLTTLIRETQDDYLNRGKLDTRIYENMLKTYATRLSKIDEQLVFMEAQEQIDQVNGFWHRLFDKK